MSFGLRIVPCAIVVLLGLGCSSSTDPTAFTKDYTAYLNQVADVLQSMKNQDGIPAAVSKLETLLSENQSLQEQAKTLSKEGDVDSAVLDQLNAASKRVQDEITRLQESKLVNPELETMLFRLSTANETTLKYAKAGSVPKPETPLEEAYVEYLQVIEDMADATNQVSDLAAAQAARNKFEELGNRRNAVYIKIAENGGEIPPQGIPKKYADHISAALKRAEQADTALAALPHANAIVELLQPLISPSEEAQNAFQLSSNIRKGGTGNRVSVILKNNELLQGPKHQQLIANLKQLAGAQQSEVAIDNDGTYRLVLSPVNDMQSFITKLNLGTISNIDENSRSFVLTVDLTKIGEGEAEAQYSGNPQIGPGRGGIGSGGPSIPGANRSQPAEAGGTLSPLDEQKIEATRSELHSREGAEKVVEIHFKNSRPFRGKRMGKVAGVITRTTGARMLKPVPIGSGDTYVFFRTEKSVKELANELDLGKIESIDEPERKLVIVLEESKVPE